MSSEFTIEPLKPDDYALVATWLSNGDANKFLDSDLRGKQMDERFITIMCMNPKCRVFLVRNGGEPAGVIGLWNIGKVDRTGGMWLLLGDRRLGAGGCMVLAARQVAKVAFEQEGLRSLSSAVMAPNLPSRLLTQEIGYRQVGIRRAAAVLDDKQVDRVVYDLTPQDLAEIEAESAG
ncbi:MAG: GNAT family N-acetyltransferase [Phycisphaera sp.]|nr:GNAT family N-acetyltransferase [Phycisphaera sp.]